MGSGASKSTQSSQTSHAPPTYQESTRNRSHSSSHATTATCPTPPTPPPAYEILEKLVIGSEYFSKQSEANQDSNHHIDKASSSAATTSSSSPHSVVKIPTVTVISSVDQPQPPGNLLGNADEMLTLLTVGTQVKDCEGALHYALVTYNTPVIVVLGRTGSTSIKLTCADYRTECGPIQRSILGLVDVIEQARDRVRQSGFSFEGMSWERSEEVRQGMYAEVNVDLQIEELIRSSRVVRDRVGSGRLYVIGMMCDYKGIYGSSGLGGGGGQGNGRRSIYMTNVNGEKNCGRIKDCIVLRNLSELQKEKFVKRLM